MKVRNIAEAPGGVILVGTTNGLLTFSNNFERLEEIKFYRNIRRPGDKNSLSANDIMHIYTDKNKTTYVVSFTGGVNKVISPNLLNENIQFKNYDKNNGLASDLALSMIEDTQNQLWVVSEIALSKFDPAKETFENYELSSIYQEFNFSEALPIINARNQIILGTDKGFLEVLRRRCGRVAMFLLLCLQDSRFKDTLPITPLTIWKNWNWSPLKGM